MLGKLSVSKVFRVATVSVILLAIGVLMLLPFYFVIMTSLKSNVDFYSNTFGLPKKFVWQNWVNAWFEAKVPMYLVNSVITSGASTLLILIVSIPFAYVAARTTFLWSKLLFVLLLSCIMISPQVILIPLFMLLRKMGLLDTRMALILPYAALGTPVAVYLLKPFFETIPSDLIDAARIDGCSTFLLLFYMFIPLGRPAIATAAIVSVVQSWSELLLVVTFISRESLQTITLGVFSLWGMYETNWGQLNAALAMSIIPVILIFVLLQRNIIQGLTAGALKG